MKDKTILEMERCLKCVGDEEELDGEMPDEMFIAYQDIIKDKKALTETLRILVRLTKYGIRERILRGE